MTSDKLRAPSSNEDEISPSMNYKHSYAVNEHLPAVKQSDLIASFVRHLGKIDFQESSFQLLTIIKILCAICD